MTEAPKKPSWFELADADAPSAQVRKVNKKLPAAALLVTGAVFAAGALFANTSEPSAVAGQSPVVQTVSSTSAASAPAVTSAPKISKASTTPAIQDPKKVGIQAPNGQRGDDHEDGEDD